MTDLHSVVAFFHKAKWTGLAVTHEIHRVPGENAISDSTVGKYVGYLFYQQKEQTLLSPRIGRWSQFWLLHHLCALRGAMSFSPTNCQEGDDVEINSVSPFDADHEMEIAASSEGLSRPDWVWKNEPGAKSNKTFGASRVNRIQRVARYCHPWRFMVLLRDRLGAAVACRGWPAGNGNETRDRSRKMMLAIFWNPDGLHLPDATPKREKYSTRYDVANIWTPICQRLIPAAKCKLVIHADDSPCQTANVILDCVSQRKIRFALHAQDSPDIASSEFFLFSNVKRELRGSRFQTGEELLVEIYENWWARSHLKLCWTLFTTGFHGAKIWSQVMETTLDKLSNGGIYFA
jgi:hypothetical protein